MRHIRYISIFIYVVFLTLTSWYINGKSLIGIDDANIYMVYMKNFANGHGFVYNIWGEKVEGFTSLLWTLIGSLFFYISSKPEILLLITNLLLITYSLYRVTCYIDKNEGRLFLSKKSFLFLAIIGITPGFIDWTVISLMETALWCFLLTITTIKILNYDSTTNKLKHFSALSLLYALLVICRPESMLWVPVFIFLNSVKEHYISNSHRLAIQWLVTNFIVFAVSLFILFLWRLDYFGYPLPNTYYAKVSSTRIDNVIAGTYYIGSLFIQKPFMLLILIHSSFFVFKTMIKKQFIPNISVYLLYAILGLSLLIPFYTGGDHFALHRFIMPSIPIIILLWILILKSNLLDNLIIPILITSTIFFSNENNFMDTFYHRNYSLKHEWNIAAQGRKSSEKLNNFFKEHTKLPSQGVLVAGSTAFSYKGETIDLLGLNNTKMAHAEKVKDKTLPKNHASFSTVVFFDLSPDVFWYCDSSRFLDANEPLLKKLIINPKDFQSTVFKKIHLNTKFKKQYGFYRINKYNTEEALQIFANKRFINSLDTTKYQITAIEYE